MLFFFFFFFYQLISTLHRFTHWKVFFAVQRGLQSELDLGAEVSDELNPLSGNLTNRNVKTYLKQEHH